MLIWYSVYEYQIDHMVKKNGALQGELNGSLAKIEDTAGIFCTLCNT